MKRDCIRKRFLFAALAGMLVLLLALFASSWRLHSSSSCSQIHALIQVQQVNSNEDHYAYTLQVQGLFDDALPSRSCGKMRAWLKMSIPASPLLSQYTSYITQLTLLDARAFPLVSQQGIQAYAPLPFRRSVALATAWISTRCAGAYEVATNFGSDSILTTKTVCAS